MAPMKVMKGTGKAMTKGAIAKTIAEKHGLSKDVADKFIASFTNLAKKEVATNCIFIFPGLCKITNISVGPKPECQKKVFGKMQTVKAKPARHKVTVQPLKALKALSCEQHI